MLWGSRRQGLQLEGDSNHCIHCSVGKGSACSARDAEGVVSVPESGRTPGVGKDNPLQSSCLENPVNRGACQAAVHRVAKSWTWLSAHSHTYRVVSAHHFLGGAGLVAMSCLTLEPQGLPSTRLLCPWDVPGKNTGVGCHFLLQGIFLTQGLNPSLLYCRQIHFLFVFRKN